MIYLDANATSRLRPAALEAARQLIAQGDHGNPSSVHGPGRRARQAIADARSDVLQLLGCAAHRLVFTSGGTEACGTLLYGFLGGLPASEISIVSSAIEHPAMLEPLAELERRGAKVTLINPTADGHIAAEDVARNVDSRTSLVSMMAANNETGAVQPVSETARLLRRNGFQGAIVCDAVQALGKSSISFAELTASGVDGIALSAHKIGGLSGCGALLLSGLEHTCRLFNPYILGGGQEWGYRAGTENLAGIVAFGAAARELAADLPVLLPRLECLREMLAGELIARSPVECSRLTPVADRDNPGRRPLANTLLLRFHGVRADDLVVALDLEGVAVSTGSACSSGKQEPSHVVRAMGYETAAAGQAVRFSLDWCTTEEEIQRAAACTLAVLERMQGLQS